MRRPGGEPPAAIGSAEALQEQAEDGVEELYRLARLITEDITSKVPESEERARALDARGLRDALARPRDMNIGQLAEGLEKAYKTLLRGAQEVPLSAVLHRLQALKPQHVGSGPGALPGELRVLSRQSSAAESPPVPRGAEDRPEAQEP